ncbi:hypothetical protein ACXYTJ_12070 [Gilvimarinus sp. F26214L]|uniref:hypothetical protein n=1 Tax=Gilvimarinus sp. DZF01 TaxID=3461371 RepID=UPI0040458F58
MPNRLFRLIPLGVLGVLVLSSGCSSLQAVWPSEKEPPAPNQASAPSPAPEPQAPASPLAARSVADDVRQLLAAAEGALAANRLTTPLHDNAFDRFQAVLLLQPDNAQARSGLQQVFSRYVGMIRSALARQQVGTARALLERAKLVEHDHPLIAEMAAEISDLQETLADQGHQDADSGKEIPLDPRSLDRREPTMIEKLKQIAVQVRDSEETLLIVARSDAEGRWIYQRMSEGVPDYRLRGDIRLGREPRILLLPPID